MNEARADVALPTSRAQPGSLVAVLVVVAAAALVPRVLGVLRGGGVFGHLGYDGSVYYAAAAGMAAGQVPYRDFLLLHPPGIMLWLAPFAELGRLLGDPIGLASARVAWMAMGALSACLAALIFRRYGIAAALAAGLAYAVFLPAIRVEHSTTLEAPGSVCVLGAIALVTHPKIDRARFATAVVLAGGLLGMASAVKIWGVVFAAVVALWCLVVRGWRDAVAFAGGVAAALVAVCLPFFIAAPAQMWRMVVADQTGRRRLGGPDLSRLQDIVGLPGLRHLFPHDALLPHLLLLIVALLLVGAAALAWRVPAGQLGVVLFAAALPLLLLSPPWALDYASLVGPSLAMIIGAATAVLSDSPDWRRRVLAGGVALATLAVYVLAAGPGKPFGRHFPGRTFQAHFARVPGCVSTDDPTLLIQADVLQRNLDRRCRFIIDLGGYSYDLQPSASAHLRRPQNAQWQHFALSYLADADASVVVRFQGGRGLSHRTWRTIQSWPVAAEVDRYQIRTPR